MIGDVPRSFFVFNLQFWLHSRSLLVRLRIIILFCTVLIAFPLSKSCYGGFETPLQGFTLDS